jgi:hypothetical protein
MPALSDSSGEELEGKPSDDGENDAFKIAILEKCN